MQFPVLSNDPPHRYSDGQRRDPVRSSAYIAVIAALVLAATSSLGEDVRLANGMIIKGEVRGATAEGLEIQTQTGSRTYPWEQLSAGTRYRHQGSYRANFDAVLQGLPPSARTNPADDEGTPVARPATQTAETPGDQPSTASRPASSLVFDQATYENIDPITIAQVPGLQLRTPSMATFVGFQYGPGKKQVVYLGFDPKSAGELRDVMFVHAPDIPAFAGTARIGGFKKGSGDSRVASFKKFGLGGQFGSVNAAYEIECVYTQTNSLNVTIYCTLSKGDAKSSFVLNGDLSDLVQGDGIINVKGILDLPVLWVSLDLTAGTPRLVGNLNMSHLKLVPKEGMENRVSIVVTSSQGEAVLREAVKLDESGFGAPHGIICDLKKVAGGQTYVVRAAIDLGPFIGPAVFEEKITVPGT